MAEPVDHEIDITIEAVTGTVYDLCVSPFETILGIKTKIQRLEGIPVFQQHLIYGETELQDDYCLEEYNIRTGCQLKLILTLRGGPVHAHRVQIEDSALLELAEYLDIQPGDDQEQYMFMLLNDGNLELVNPDDHSQLQSPVELSESRVSGGSQTSLLAATIAPPNAVTVVENMNTKDKMRDLQSRLKSLRLNRAEHQLPKKPSNLKRKCTAKVIILDSRASNRTVRVSPTPVTPPQPPSHICTNPSSSQCFMCPCQHRCPHCHNVSAKSQRKLIFRSHPPEFTVSRMKGSRTVSREKQHKLLANIVEQPPPAPAPPLPSSFHYNSNRRRKLKPISSTNSFISPPTSNEYYKPDPMNSGNGKGFPRTNHVKSRERSSHHKRPLMVGKEDQHYLPPVINKRSIIEMNNPEIFQKSSKSRKNRCMQCGKKTRIAATYTCRCGGMFCGAHRYAETHSCTHDYKTEGKETIARNNPLVVATKLPKI